jgi:hypothetical protein
MKKKTVKSAKKATKPLKTIPAPAPGCASFQLPKEEVEALITLLGINQAMWQNLCATAELEGKDETLRTALAARAKMCGYLSDRIKLSYTIGEPESRDAH